MRRRLVAALAVAVLAAAGAVVGLGIEQRRRDQGETGTRLQRLADEVVASGIPGTIVLLRDGSTEWSAASGLADRERRRPMARDLRFRIGSVTKTMVATVVLQLVAEKRLHLEDSVERWLPGLVPNGRRIKLRHLLSHTSGLADYVDADFVRRAPAWKPRRVAAYAVSRPPIFSPPGAQFAYASTNYVLLGLVVEEATRSELARELRERIFEPLQLGRTSFSTRRIRGNHVRGYRAPERQGIVSRHLIDVTDDSAAGAWAAGAVVSTTHDVARFFSALLGGELIPPRQLRAMTTAAVTPPRYGLGLAIFDTPCGKVLGHTGNINGQISAVWNSPNASRQLVAMANAYPLSPDADATLRRTLESAFCAL